jgi:hypothetical protein
MNMSDVINDIKMRLGLNAIALPFDRPTEVVIREILQGTIRTFSQFKPDIKETYATKDALKSPNDAARKVGIFILPPEVTRTPVQYADAYPMSSVTVDEEATTNPFTIGSPFVGFGSYYPQDIMNAELTGAAINKFIGVTSSPASSKWLGYNQIQLFNFPDEALVRFVVKCDHDPQGESIPVSCRESFIELATLDVEMTLYNLLKNMNNVGSAFKEIQLKIDEWSGAEGNRNQLIEKWTTTFHFDQIDLISFF